MTPRIAYGADTIEIIDSIPEGESQTARHVEDHIRDLSQDPAVVQIPVTRHRVSTATELFVVLSDRVAAAVEKNLWPLIHIECHGSKEGLRLCQGTFIEWAEIQPYLLALNKATRNHLFIIMAACNGFHGIKAMLDRVDHAASLRLLGGPAEETTSGRVEAAMKGFYAALLRTGDLDAAAVAARNAEATFRLYVAEVAFMTGWRKAMEQFRRTGKGLQGKTEQIVTMMKNAGMSLPDRPHARTKAAIRQLDMNVPFQAFRRRFFMLDLFPEVETEIAATTSAPPDTETA